MSPLRKHKFHTEILPLLPMVAAYGGVRYHIQVSPGLVEYVSGERVLRRFAGFDTLGAGLKAFAWISDPPEGVSFRESR